MTKRSAASPPGPAGVVPPTLVVNLGDCASCDSTPYAHWLTFVDIIWIAPVKEVVTGYAKESRVPEPSDLVPAPVWETKDAEGEPES